MSSEIEFKPEECEVSLLRTGLENESEIDLELGNSKSRRLKQHTQQTEQYKYFQDKDSLDFALEGSLLNPIENFGQCLSECTFILEEKGLARGNEDKQSNFLDKG